MMYSYLNNKLYFTFVTYFLKYVTNPSKILSQLFKKL